jgi:hypothetical protein
VGAGVGVGVGVGVAVAAAGAEGAGVGAGAAVATAAVVGVAAGAVVGVAAAVAAAGIPAGVEAGPGGSSRCDSHPETSNTEASARIPNTPTLTGGLTAPNIPLTRSIYLSSCISPVPQRGFTRQTHRPKKGIHTLRGGQ